MNKPANANVSNPFTAAIHAKELPARPELVTRKRARSTVNGTRGLNGPNVPLLAEEVRLIDWVIDVTVVALDIVVDFVFFVFLSPF